MGMKYKRLQSRLSTTYHLKLTYVYLSISCFMKKLAGLILAVIILFAFDGCSWINRDEPAEINRDEPAELSSVGLSTSVATPAAIRTVIYSGIVSEGPWASFHFPFKKPFKGDIRIKNLTVKFTDGADVSQTFFLGGIEIRNFPSDASIDDNEPERAINIIRAGNLVDIIFTDAKFSGTVNGDKIEGEFERKVSINDRDAGGNKDVYVKAPITLHRQ